MFHLKSLILEYPDLRIAVDPFELVPAHHEQEALYVQAPSGFGKTTLLRAIAGLEACQGEFTNSDKPVHERNIGFVFQDQLLLSHLNAIENVMLGMELHGVSKSDARVQAEAGLKALGLESRLRAPVTTLSGGERQRVALLRALLTRPSLLLLDEPMRGLDADSKKRILEYLRHFLAEHPVPMIWVSHEDETGNRLVGITSGAANERKFIYTPARQ